MAKYNVAKLDRQSSIEHTLYTGRLQSGQDTHKCLSLKNHSKNSMKEGDYFEEEIGRRRAPDYIPESYDTHMKTIWLTEELETKDIAFKHITSILDDVLIEIGYTATAREEAESDRCYVQNDCFYKMEGRAFTEIHES